MTLQELLVPQQELFVVVQVAAKASIILRLRVLLVAKDFDGSNAADQRGRCLADKAEEVAENVLCYTLLLLDVELILDFPIF